MSDVGLNEPVAEEGTRDIIPGLAVSPKKKPGRPKKVILRPALREPVREVRAEPSRIRHKDTGGRFYIPPEYLARLPDRSVEWKRYTVLGQEDPAYQLDLKRAGWEPVQSHQMPGLMPQGHKGAIIRDGLILCERPQELTNEARAEDLAEANDRIRNSERRLGISGPGEMTRDHPLVQPRINKSFEPLARRQA